MLYIKNIGKKVSKEENCAYLIADIEIDALDIENWKVNMEKIEKKNYQDLYQIDFLKDGKFSIWYKVPLEYEEVLCHERSDAFIVGVLYFAMVSGCDIKSEVPMTEQLYRQIKENMIPIMCNEKTGYPPIDIICKTEPELENIYNFAGTGASGGVDSFAAILSAMDEKLPKEDRLTHLAYFNVGALNFAEYLKPYTLKSWNENAQKEFKLRSEKAAKIAEEMNLKLITVDSNLSDLYQGSFFYSVTYRTCSAVFATQKMWSKYYFASAGYLSDLDPSPSNNSGHFEKFIFKNFNTNNLTFYSQNGELTRHQKTQMLVDNSAAQKMLNVCSFEIENCGECDKCIRTILSLDVLGALDKFSESFKNLKKYKKYKWVYWGRVRFCKPDDEYMSEIKMYIKKKNISYPKLTLIYPLSEKILKFLRFIKKAIRR